MTMKDPKAGEQPRPEAVRFARSFRVQIAVAMVLVITVLMTALTVRIVQLARSGMLYEESRAVRTYATVFAMLLGDQLRARQADLRDIARDFESSLARNDPQAARAILERAAARAEIEWIAEIEDGHVMMAAGASPPTAALASVSGPRVFALRRLVRLSSPGAPDQKALFAAVVPLGRPGRVLVAGFRATIVENVEDHLDLPLDPTDTISISAADSRGIVFVSERVNRLGRQRVLPSEALLSRSAVVAVQNMDALTITASEPLAVATAAAETFRRTAIQFSLILLVLGVTTAWIATGRVSRPLRALANAAMVPAPVGARDFPFQGRPDEIGALSRAFSGLLSTVSAKSRELERTNETLLLELEEHARLERAARQARADLDDLVGNVPGIVYRADAGEGRRFRYVSRGVTEILDSDEQEITSLENFERAFVHPDDLKEVLASVHRAATTGEPFEIVYRVRTRTNRERWVHDKGRTRIDDGTPFILGAMIDITERETLRGELEQARRVALLGQLVAQSAHEFRNVLMVIQTFAELIKRSATGLVQTHAIRVLDAVRRGRQIASSTLQYVRPRPPARELLDLGEWLERFASDTRAGLPPAIRLTVRCERPLPNVSADHELLYQVFYNLTSNAVDVLDGKGDIEISARGFSESGRSSVEILVRDSGRGIPEEALDHIFEVLFSTKRKGTGLGLAVSRQIVEHHGGTITARSQPGSGTTFRVILPAAEGKAALPAASLETAPLSRTVLLVEDDRPPGRESHGGLAGY